MGISRRAFVKGAFTASTLATLPARLGGEGQTAPPRPAPQSAAQPAGTTNQFGRAGQSLPEEIDGPGRRTSAGCA